MWMCGIRSSARSGAGLEGFVASYHGPLPGAAAYVENGEPAEVCEQAPIGKLEQQRRLEQHQRDVADALRAPELLPYGVVRPRRAVAPDATNACTWRLSRAAGGGAELLKLSAS